MCPIPLTSFSASVREAVHRAASANVPILLSGETGCGKTVLARLIHEASPRSQRQFTRVDCGSIPDTLFEREMFGHVRGAFTDAKDSQPGLFEATDGGTVFLDEIGEVPLAVQPKLLSVLDEGLVRRIGSIKNSNVDVRVVAASNRDLPEMIRARQFRADLFYRLGFLRIQLPPLRERRESIGQLAAETLQKLIADKRVSRTALPKLDPRTIECLRAHAWPGNIRELEQVMTFALTYCDLDTVLPEHLPSEVLGQQSSRDARCERASDRYVAPQDRGMERQALLEALTACGGNRVRAAERLGMCRATLWSKLRQFGMTVDGMTAQGDGTDRAAHMGVRRDRSVEAHHCRCRWRPSSRPQVSGAYFGSRSAQHSMIGVRAVRSYRVEHGRSQERALWRIRGGIAKPAVEAFDVMLAPRASGAPRRWSPSTSAAALCARCARRQSNANSPLGGPVHQRSEQRSQRVLGPGIWPSA